MRTATLRAALLVLALGACAGRVKPSPTPASSTDAEEQRTYERANLLRSRILAAAGWADRVPGVVAARVEGGRHVVTLERDADDQPLLAAALATGPVHGFERRRTTLTELFRHVVAAAPGAAAPAAPVRRSERVA